MDLVNFNVSIQTNALQMHLSPTGDTTLTEMEKEKLQVQTHARGEFSVNLHRAPDTFLTRVFRFVSKMCVSNSTIGALTRLTRARVHTNAGN